MASQALPSCVAFQSKENGKFLRYVHQSGEAHMLLHMSGEDAINPFTRFYLEPSKKHDGLVHIRCCYNNKYWTARNVDGKWWVLGDANEPDEDPSNPAACTLFKPILIHDNDNSITSCRIFHRQLGEEALMLGAPDVDGGKEALKGCMQLHVGASSEAELTVRDLSDQPVLPTDVSFVADNERFLRGVEMQHPRRQWNPFLQFHGDDVGEADVRHVVETNNKDGSLRIRSLHFDRYWRGSPNNWILADASASHAGNDSRFRAYRVQIDGQNFVALRNLGNNLFCKRLTISNSVQSILSADVATISVEARLRVRETVLSRRIFNVVYDFANMTERGRTPVSMDHSDALNDTDSPNRKKVTLTRKTLEERRWDTSVGFNLGVSTTITAGIPSFLGAQTQISAEFSGTYDWGKTQVVTGERSVEYDLPVPPRTRVTVTLMATESRFDIPFTYDQEDVLTDGRIRVTTGIEDGMYMCVTSYGFKYDTKEQRL